MKLFAIFSLLFLNVLRISGASIDDFIVYDPEVGLPSDTPISKIDLNVYRFHEEKQRYFKLGETSPCGKLMRFFADPKNEKIGLCDCDWFQCSRPLLYHQLTDQCFWGWSKGPCNEGEWYTFGKGMLPICEKHPCPENDTKDDYGGPDFFFQNPKDKKCYKGGSKEYCKEDDEQLWIYPYEPIPQCRSYTLCYALSVPVQDLCIQGNRRHQDPKYDCSFNEKN